MTEPIDFIPMDPKCPRCDKPHGIEVSGDGYELDCGACGGHLMCAIGPDGGEMYEWDREDEPVDLENRLAVALAEADGKQHVTNDFDDCVSWCPACRENTARGLNPDGTALHG